MRVDPIIWDGCGSNPVPLLFTSNRRDLWMVSPQKTHSCMVFTLYLSYGIQDKDGISMR